MNGRVKRTLAGLAVVSGLLLAVRTAEAADVREHTLKFSFVLVKDTPLGLGAQKFADLVSQKSDGKIKVRLYPGGTLGGDMQVISSMQGGTIDLTALNAGLLAGHVKEFAVLDLPFLFNNEREADALVDGPVGTRLLDQLPAKGLVGLTFWEYGFRNITNSKRPIAKLEDIQGLKLRVVQAPIYIDLFNTMGANAVPLPFPELYTALEGGTVDGQENPVNVTLLSKFNEVQKYLSLTRHIYNPLAVVISGKTWDKLSADERRIILDAANEAKLYERQVAREQDTQALETLRKTIQINEVAPEETARMREKAKPVIDKYTKEVGEPLVEQVNAEIAKVRGSQ